MSVAEMVTNSPAVIDAELQVARIILNQQFVLYFISLGLIIFVFYLIYRFYKYVWEPSLKRYRYTELYELWKVGEALKDRSLSFEKLDEFEAKMFPKRKNSIEEIDAKYAKEKEPKK